MLDILGQSRLEEVRLASFFTRLEPSTVAANDLWALLGRHAIDQMQQTRQAVVRTVLVACLHVDPEHQAGARMRRTPGLERVVGDDRALRSTNPRERVAEKFKQNGRGQHFPPMNRFQRLLG